tara:strand:+ start:6953 stop:7159 length:207 start_codon:yes stop_codon:yes gene_type:complete
MKPILKSRVVEKIETGTWKKNSEGSDVWFEYGIYYEITLMNRKKMGELWYNSKTERDEMYKELKSQAY